MNLTARHQSFVRLLNEQLHGKQVCSRRVQVEKSPHTTPDDVMLVLNAIAAFGMMILQQKIN